jgi:hypothetical protein
MDELHGVFFREVVGKIDLTVNASIQQMKLSIDFLVVLFHNVTSFVVPAFSKQGNERDSTPIGSLSLYRDGRIYDSLPIQHGRL